MGEGVEVAVGVAVGKVVGVGVLVGVLVGVDVGVTGCPFWGSIETVSTDTGVP